MHIKIDQVLAAQTDNTAELLQRHEATRAAVEALRIQVREVRNNQAAGISRLVAIEEKLDDLLRLPRVYLEALTEKSAQHESDPRPTPPEASP